MTSLDTALAEARENIPWEQVKTDLGWSGALTELNLGQRRFANFARLNVRCNLEIKEQRRFSPKIRTPALRPLWAGPKGYAEGLTTSESLTPSTTEFSSSSSQPLAVVVTSFSDRAGGRFASRRLLKSALRSSSLRGFDDTYIDTWLDRPQLSYARLTG